MSIQRRSDELVDLLRPDFVGNDGTASPSFVWVCAGAGTAAAPGFRFCADPDTGFFSAAANAIGVAIAGGELARWTATGLGIGAFPPDDILHLTKAFPVIVLETTATATKSYLGSVGVTEAIAVNRQPATGVFSDPARAAAGINLNAGGADSNIVFYTHNVNNVAPIAQEYINNVGDFYPARNKVQNLGLAGNRWNVVYSGAADSVGTSRVYEIEKSCSVCGHKLLKGTGCLCILGEDRDYETAFCPECGTVVMDEMQHLPAAKLAMRRPAPTITFLGFEAFVMSGNSRKIRADFMYGEDVWGIDEKGEPGIVASAPRNSTYLGEFEIESFLQMSEPERAVFLRALGQREWDALEETRLMEGVGAAAQAQFDLAGAALIGRDLQQLEKEA